MKILEELKHEQARRRAESPQRGQPAPDRAPATEPVQRSMELIYGSLARFAEELNQLDAPARVSYDVELMGPLKDLLQSTYTVATEDAARPSFAFSFECAGRHGVNRLVDTVSERDQLQTLLESLGMSFQIDDMSTWRYAVTVKPTVKVRLLFTPTSDGRAIRLEARNLNRLGVELFSMQPQQVTEELVNELGKLILRRDNRFVEMIGNQVPEETRELLRARVKLRERKRAKEAEAIHKDIAAHKGGLKKLLRRAEAPEAPLRRVQRDAPVMVAESAPEQGWVNWEDDERSPDAERVPPHADPLEGSDAVVPKATFESSALESPRYAWMITKDLQCIDTAGSIAKRGPSGSASKFPVPVIINTGENFRLKTRDGTMRYFGVIAGEYQGVEPLVDFGLNHGCALIEYEREGQWVRVRTTD